MTIVDGAVVVLIAFTHVLNWAPFAKKDSA